MAQINISLDKNGMIGMIDQIGRIIRHDIRTSLNTIQFFSNRLKKTQAESDRKTDWVDMMIQSCTQIRFLIDHAFDVFYMVQGTYKLSQSHFNFVMLLKRIDDSLAEIKKIHSLSIHYDLNDEPMDWNSMIEMYGDANQLKILFEMLFNDAIHSPKNTISVQIVPLDHSIQISIHYTGFQDDMDYSLDYLSTHLSSLKKRQFMMFKAFMIVHSHMGTMTIKNIQNEKGQIIVSLPVHTQKIQTIDNQKSILKQIDKKTDLLQTKPLRLLVVEDNPNNQIVIQSYLSQKSHNVTIANNGHDAIQLFKSFPPFDVILMDIHMPFMDGFETTKQIRILENNLGIKKIPIIALTADVQKDIPQKCLEVGIQSIIEKPITDDSIFDIHLNHALNLK